MALQTFASCGTSVKIWSGNSVIQQLIPYESNIKKEHNIASISWSPSASCCDVSNKVIVIDVNCPTKKISLVPSETTSFVSYYLKRNSNVISCGQGSTICIWDLKSQSVTKRLKISFNDTSVNCATSDKRDAFIACGMKNGAVQIINSMTTSAHPPIVCSNVMAITSLRFSNSSKNWLGTSSDDGACNLWDYDMNKRIHCFEKCHVAPATGISFCPTNENLLATSGFDKKIYFYDLRHRKFVKEILTEEPLRCLDFSNEGHRTAVGSTRGSIFMFDLRSSKISSETIKNAHNGSVNAVLFRKVRDVRDDFTICSSKRDISSLSEEIKEFSNDEKPLNVSSRWQIPSQGVDVANKSTITSTNTTNNSKTSKASIMNQSTSKSSFFHHQTMPLKFEDFNVSATIQKSYVQPSIEEWLGETQIENSGSSLNTILHENSCLGATINKSVSEDSVDPVANLQLIIREEVNEIKKDIDERIFALHSYCIHRFIDIEDQFEQCHKKLDNISDKITELLNRNVRY